MRVVMLTSGHPVNDERITYKQALSLARLGHEVTVFGRQPVGAYLPCHPNLRLVPMTPSSRLRLERLNMLILLYRAARTSRPEIIVCHEPESVLVGLLGKLMSGARLVFDVHECWDGLVIARLGGWLGSLGAFVMRLLLMQFARRSDWVTVVSPVTFEEYRRFRRDNRVDILHNSPRIEWFPKSDQTPAGPITVLHDGILDKSRGMVEMLEAVSIAGEKLDIRFLLVGLIAGEDQALFSETVRRLDLGHRVEITPWLPYEKIGEVESRAHIGLIALRATPNARGSLNNKLYNYMACGIPVIAPKGTATEKVVRHYNCGLTVDTSEPLEIAAAIAHLGADRAMRIKLGDRGRQAIEEELGWHKMEEKMQHIYCSLGTERHSGPGLHKEVRVRP